PFRTKVSALFSADGKTAVVLRRGPRLHNHLIRWSLKHDTFEHGQWMKGTVVLCDLDRTGERLLYWARQWHQSAPKHDEPEPQERRSAFDPLDNGIIRRKHRGPGAKRALNAQSVRQGPMRPRRNEGVWTAISRAPFFSALAIWPSYGHWTGGGHFRDSSTVVLEEDDRGLIPKVNVPLPGWLTITNERPPGLAPLDRAPSLATRPDTAVYGRWRSTLSGEIADAMAEEGVRWVEWIYPKDRDLLFCADGQLFRLPRWQGVPPREMIHKAQRLLDLRPLRFERIAPPTAALQWGGRPSPSGPMKKGGRGLHRRA
ncbi:MAG: hypothetical protein AAGJ94_11835, partial [Pseudomonadota bacterium]